MVASFQIDCAIIFRALNLLEPMPQFRRYPRLTLNSDTAPEKNGVAAHRKLNSERISHIKKRQRILRSHWRFYGFQASAFAKTYSHSAINDEIKYKQINALKVIA